MKSKSPSVEGSRTPQKAALQSHDGPGPIRKSACAAVKDISPEFDQEKQTKSDSTKGRFFPTDLLVTRPSTPIWSWARIWARESGVGHLTDGNRDGSGSGFRARDYAMSPRSVQKAFQAREESISDRRTLGVESPTTSDEWNQCAGHRASVLPIFPSARVRQRL